jgi:hypothetical protein
MSEGTRININQERKINDKLFGNKTYHYYRTVYTRDALAIKERYLRKRGYEFKLYVHDGKFDIYTYPEVS